MTESQIKVYLRPLNKNSEFQILDNQIISDNLNFQFQNIFQNQETKQIFDDICLDLIQKFKEGYNTSLMCYGQTGSGKTYTITGNDEKQGILQYTFQNIIQNNYNKSIQLSIFEIYQEKINDLISNQSNLTLRQNDKQVYIQNLTSLKIESVDQLNSEIKNAIGNKQVRQTKLNQQSSRSHCIYQLTLNQLKDDCIVESQMNIIDLAGSERINKSQLEGISLEECKKINQSLLNLGNVINSLQEQKQHIPYRDSKLTRILQESLGGNCESSIIINSNLNFKQETLQALRFGQRAQCIKNVTTINKQMSIEQLQDQLVKQQKIIEQQNQQIQCFSELKNIPGNYLDLISQLKSELREKNELINQLSNEKNNQQQINQNINTIINISQKDENKENKENEEEKNKINNKHYQKQIKKILKNNFKGLQQINKIINSS